MKEKETNWNQSIRYVKGVGDRLGSILAKKGIQNIEDAIFYFPRTYEDRRTLWSVKDARLSDQASVYGRILRSTPISFTRSRKRAYELVLQDLQSPSSLFKLKWFYRPYNLSELKEGSLLVATGKVSSYQGQLQMLHPELEFVGKNPDEVSFTPSILPIYSQAEGLYQKTIRKIERRVVELYSSFLEDPLPESLREKHQMMPLKEAVRALHLPQPDEDFRALVAGLSPAHQRLIYDEFFFFTLVLSLQRQMFTEKTGISFKKPAASWLKLKENLAFQFTSAQKRVLKEILDDMERPQAMYRLLQGDVGSGKTVVAAAVSLVALESDYQVAFMAPTEVLVEQHFEKFKKWFEGLPFECLKLTGSMKAAEKRDVLDSLKDVRPKIVFGTHALFEDKVQFSKLGLVVVDEQHRFGVRQRARLVAKGQNPDVLVMTATPIPRSLALTIYGDLDVSILDELPPGRKPVKTQVFSSQKEETFHRLVKEQLGLGRQAYFVYPLIEESEVLDLQSIEKALPRLREIYRDFSLEFLHGRQEAAEKNQILKNFKSGKTQILVSTTVIEVGVDVPNASVMLIHNADRFGLSQLHQLRGRIGRGSDEAFCYLVSDLMNAPDVKKRLKTMEQVSDGFKLSEIDLEIRGPGEFIGTRQSGLPEFRLANLPRDLRLLQKARQDAHDVLRQDPFLKSHPLLLAYLRRKFQSFEIS